MQGKMGQILPAHVVGALSVTLALFAVAGEAAAEPASSPVVTVPYELPPGEYYPPVEEPWPHPQGMRRYREPRDFRGPAAGRLGRVYLINLRVAPGWQISDPIGGVDQRHTNLAVGIDYGFSLVRGARAALYLLTPAWLQINTDAPDRNTFFGAGIGFQLDVYVLPFVAIYTRFSTGVGGGFSDAEPPYNAIGLLNTVSVGVKLTSGYVHFGVEPLSLPILTPLGRGAPGSLVFYNLAANVSILF